MKKALSMILAMGMILALTACGSKASTSAPTSPEEFEPVHLRWASQAPVSSHSETVQLEMVKKIEEATEGRIKIDWFGNAQLGDANAVFEEVMSGTIDMAQITVPETFDPRINTPMLPFLVTNYDDAREVLGPDSWVSEQLTAFEAELGLQHLSVSPEGLVGCVTNKPVKDPTVIGAEKGVQLRVPPNDSFRLPVEALGFRTSTIPYSELYTSIETGIVDGTAAFDPYATLLYLGDVVNHYYDYQESGEFSQVIMNKDLFDSLLPQDQETLLELFDQYFYDIIDGYEELEAESLQKMIDDPNWTVVTFTEEEHAAFAKTVRETVWPELAELYGEDYIAELLTHLPELKY